MMTECHQSDLGSVGSPRPESTIKHRIYSKTHFSHQTINRAVQMLDCHRGEMAGP